jgi:hypothetical protein
MYYQENTTTTESTESVRTQRAELPDTPPPVKRTAREIAFRQFEEANDRKMTRAEQRLLKMLVADIEERAELSPDHAWRWIADAIDEAVSAGSAFVAPKRVQEIVLRWSRDGRGDRENCPVSQPAGAPVTSRSSVGHRSSQQGVTGGDNPGHERKRRTVPAPPRRGDAIKVGAFEVPECGLTNHQVWQAVIDELERNGLVPRVDLDAWVRMSMVVDAGDDALVVGVPNVLAERRAAGRYRATLEDAVRRVTGVRFGIEVVVGSGEDEEERASGT